MSVSFLVPPESRQDHSCFTALWKKSTENSCFRTLRKWRHTDGLSRVPFLDVFPRESDGLTWISWKTLGKFEVLSSWQRKTGIFVSWGLFVSVPWWFVCNMSTCFIFSHVFHDASVDEFVLVLPIACICSAKVVRLLLGVIRKVPSAEFLSKRMSQVRQGKSICYFILFRPQFLDMLECTHLTTCSHVFLLLNCKVLAGNPEKHSSVPGDRSCSITEFCKTFKMRGMVQWPKCQIYTNLTACIIILLTTMLLSSLSELSVPSVFHLNSAYEEEEVLNASLLEASSCRSWHSKLDAEVAMFGPARCKTFVRCQCQEGKTSEMYQAPLASTHYLGGLCIFKMFKGSEKQVWNDVWMLRVSGTHAFHQQLPRLLRMGKAACPLL